MQISLTKNLATAIGVKPAIVDEAINPLFCWTANWTNTFESHKEDMVIMVNQATRFTVSIYGVKHNQFKKIQEKMIAAIKNTLLSMNLNPELVDEYMSQAGAVSFTANHNRKMAAQVSRLGPIAAFTVGRAVNESQGRLKYEDTLGRTVSKQPVNYSKNYEDLFIPAQKMTSALSDLTGKLAYQYRAFELLVTLDLEIYKAVRRLLVPANIEFQELHNVLQHIFGWKNYHLYDFAVFDEQKRELCTRLIPEEEGLSYDDAAELIDGHKLSEYFPKHSRILYTYDMGDGWEHEIELVRVIDEHHEESPYLLEANGQTPPEDVGGVGGYIEFRKIMLNTNHPEHAKTKSWAGYWLPELSEWDARPKVIDSFSGETTMAKRELIESRLAFPSAFEDLSF